MIKTVKSRQQMLSLHLRDKNSLYAAYMPFLQNGGLFVPTHESYELADEVFVLLTLPEQPDKIPVAGRVAWKTPVGAVGNRIPGIGVQFSERDGPRVRNLIETLLAGRLEQDKPTHTL
ncbi:MAG: PilZ domain-containing protein [Pseudomonadota bacterium]